MKGGTWWFVLKGFIPAQLQQSGLGYSVRHILPSVALVAFSLTYSVDQEHLESHIAAEPFKCALLEEIGAI